MHDRSHPGAGNDVRDPAADPSKYDFLLLGSSVIVYKLTIRKRVKKHLAVLEGKPVVLFTVSGAPAGPKLNGWVADSLPAELLSRAKRVALGGRLDPKSVGLWTRLILLIGAWKSDDPEVRKQELKGFDFVDKSTIEPVVELVRELQSGQAAA